MIVVGGEALVDLVPDPSTVAGELGPLHPRLGGGPYNVAIALGRLDVPTSFLARLSLDQFGVKLFERLSAANVDDQLVQRGPEPTTLAIVGIDVDGSARYSFHTAGTSCRYVTDPGSLPEETTAVSFGTLSLVLEPGATVYEAVLLREARRGRFIALDPNIRADLIEDAAAYRQRFAKWLPSVDLLKVSVDDARWLLGADEPELVEALRRWQRTGPTVVVLTRGAEGLGVLTAAGHWVEVPAVQTEVADTIGAGDTVQAALLAWLHHNEALSTEAVRALGPDDWEQALAFAAAASSITASRAGAEPPYRAELNAERT